MIAHILRGASRPKADPAYVELLAHCNAWRELGEYLAELRAANADMTPLMETTHDAPTPTPQAPKAVR